MYTTTKTRNTRHFLDKLVELGLPESAITELTDSDYIPQEPVFLMTSTYADCRGNNVYHTVLEKWLKTDMNKKLSYVLGSIVGGNRGFGDMFAYAARTLYRDHGIPCLFTYEIRGSYDKAEALLKSAYEALTERGL